jgi:hypothetical protein
MVFRRIYWVVEEVKEGKTSVRGVFTSIADLLDRYLAKVSSDKPDNLIITLVRLDSSEGVLGRWESPTFDGLRESLNQYIQTGEFAIDQCDRMEAELTAAFR